jgi:RNA polymerase sigma-70 factor (ECF subfamily)
VPPESVVAQSPAAADARLVEALRNRDETVFAALVREHSPMMLRVARLFVRDRAVAEEVVQEAWLGVLRGIGSFEGRSSLRTWLFRILTNTAKTRAAREGRSVPFSALAPEGADDEPAVDAERFLHEGRWAGHWSAPPSPWELPEGRLLAAEARVRLEAAIAALPAAQAAVLTMRDVLGFDSADVCNVLGVGETNGRVLLHRARSKVRQALEDYLRT